MDLMGDAPVRVVMHGVWDNGLGTKSVVDVDTFTLRSELTIVKNLGQADGWIFRWPKNETVDTVPDFGSEIRESENLDRLISSRWVFGDSEGGVGRVASFDHFLSSFGNGDIGRSVSGVDRWADLTNDSIW